MATQNPRTVSASASSKGLVDVTSLVLLAVLLAAGLILNMTVGNAMAMTGIKPQFIIAAYSLAVLLTNASFVQAGIYGLIAAAVIQLNTSIPGLNFLTELAGALTMCALVKARLGGKINPFVGTFCATFVSGALFAVLGTLIMGAELGTCLVKLPIILGTACFDSIVVQALSIPLAKVLKK